MSEPSRDAVAEALAEAERPGQPTHGRVVRIQHLHDLAAEVRRLEAELGRRGAAPDGLLREASNTLEQVFSYAEMTGSLRGEVRRTLLKLDAALSALLDAPRDKNLGSS